MSNEGNQAARRLPHVPYQKPGQQFQDEVGVEPISTHIVTVPVKFVTPPTSRDAVWEALGPLPGWNSLEPRVGTNDPTLFDLRLDVNADSEDEAAKIGERMYPAFFGRLKSLGPQLEGPVSAVSREDYLGGAGSELGPDDSSGSAQPKGAVGQ